MDPLTVAKAESAAKMHPVLANPDPIIEATLTIERSLLATIHAIDEGSKTLGVALKDMRNGPVAVAVLGLQNDVSPSCVL